MSRFFKAEHSGLVMVRDAGEYAFAVAAFLGERVTFHRSREAAETARYEDLTDPGFAIVPAVEIDRAEFRRHCRGGRDAGIAIVDGRRSMRIAKIRRRRATQVAA